MQKLKCENIDEIVGLLESECVLAIPTDTVYGFSCLATSEKAVKKIYEMKQRNEQKSFIILVSKNYDLSKIVKVTKNIEFIKKNSPAPLTMIVNKCDDFKLAPSFYLPTIAIRIPDNDFLQSILDKVGYMVSTSCNKQGEPNINDFSLIEDVFPEVDAVVETVVDIKKPSTIIDLTEEEIKIIRQGDYQIK